MVFVCLMEMLLLLSFRWELQSFLLKSGLPELSNMLEEKFLVGHWYFNTMRLMIHCDAMKMSLNMGINHFLLFLATTLLFLISTFSTSLPRPDSIAWITLGLSALKVKKYLPLLILNLVILAFFLMNTAG